MRWRRGPPGSPAIPGALSALPLGLGRCPRQGLWVWPPVPQGGAVGVQSLQITREASIVPRAPQSSPAPPGLWGWGGGRNLERLPGFPALSPPPNPWWVCGKALPGSKWALQTERALGRSLNQPHSHSSVHRSACSITSEFALGWETLVHPGSLGDEHPPCSLSGVCCPSRGLPGPAPLVRLHKHHLRLLTSKALGTQQRAQQEPAPGLTRRVPPPTRPWPSRPGVPPGCGAQGPAPSSLPRPLHRVRLVLRSADALRAPARRPPSPCASQSQRRSSPAGPRGARRWTHRCDPSAPPAS